MMNDLRYPIGRFERPESISQSELQTAINAIGTLPGDLRAAASGLDDKQLDTPYRSDGWTVRQVVHHVADSHMNSYIRMRLGLTEDEPTISPYDENAWANLVDARHAEIEPSLALLEALHRRWTMLLKSFTDNDWKRTFRHPERGAVRLDVNAMLYAWHGKHHVAHITSLRDRNRW
jgi:DinB superfamily